jgi:uncharacterized protein YlxP (DUF503 family)
VFVGLCSFDLLLAENHSLKGKRRVLKKVKDRVRNTFNVSIAEIDNLDSWQRCTLGVACVSREKPQLEKEISKVLTFVDSLHLAELENIHREIL